MQNAEWASLRCTTLIRKESNVERGVRSAERPCLSAECGTRNAERPHSANAPLTRKE